VSVCLFWRTAGHQSPFRFRQLLGRLFGFSRTTGTPLWESLVIRFPFLITSHPTGYHLPWLEDRDAMSQRTALRAAGHHFHFRFCRLHNRLFGMFENDGPRILENRVSAGCFDWEPQWAINQVYPNFWKISQPVIWNRFENQSGGGGRQAQTSKYTHLIENRCENFRSSDICGLRPRQPLRGAGRGATGGWSGIATGYLYLYLEIENCRGVQSLKVILKPSTREATFWHFWCIFLSWKSRYLEPIPSNPSTIAHQLNSRHDWDMVRLSKRSPWMVSANHNVWSWSSPFSCKARP